MNDKKIAIDNSRRRNPGWWIPTLYIAEGLPYFAVNTIAVLMYVKMGISNAEMAFYTGWLYLPWVIKPFWSPFVDIIKSKRWWTISMQFIIAFTMAAIAFLLPTSFFFASTLAVFWVMAFCSATHDIAADGYYMLELKEHEQAAFVGVRSTFYRIASVIGQGGLVVVAADRTSARVRTRFIRQKFLGKDADFPYGVFLMTALLKAPTYFVYGLRDKTCTLNPKNHMFVEKSNIDFDCPRSERENRINELCAEYINSLEKKCLEFPYQWYNFYNFWLLQE